MTTALNPFPDYAVKRLVVGHDTGASTIVTAAIGKGRELVKTYLSALDAPVPAKSAALCAVRGDYGTGKTHLLNDVAAHLEQMCGTKRSPAIVRATCIEADPMFWYRTQLGPQLDTLPLYDVALHLYGQAGKTVASATELTESAAAVLQQDPARIRELIRTNYISVDEVTREFNKELDRICKDYDTTIRRVLSRLVSSETDGPARQWIRGETLTDRNAELLGVPNAIDSAEQASSVIGAIVALHKAVGRPFLVLMDEFEHFVRYDVSQNASANVTWLKRLLEHLGNAGALALVAGHWSAWQTAKDYLDRFPQHAPIDLVKLETSDVMKILKERVTSLPKEVGEAQAQIIVSLTAGNMRRVMSLCNLLFRQSHGFATPVTDKEIHAAWTAVAQRISQEQVLEEVVAMLTPRGFVVKTTDANFHSVPFDLVAERGDGRVLVVQAKHSETQADHYDAARRFIDKLTSVANFAPTLVGLFLANGSIDDELLDILRKSGMPNLRWFDLTEREVMEKIRAEIAAIDGQSALKPVATPTSQVIAVAPGVVSISAAPANTQIVPAPAGPSVAGAPPILSSAAAAAEAESAKLRAMNAELEWKLRELDERRHRETVELKKRLDQLSEARQSSRYASVQQESRINPERAHSSYEAMLEEPSFDKKLRHLGPQLLYGLFVIGLGLFLYLGRDGVSYVLYRELTAPGLALAVLGGISLSLAGVWLIWRAYTRVADYFEFSRQTLRDLYVRDLPIEALSRVNTILRQSIARHSARVARRAAIDRLTSPEQGLPDTVRHYFEELYH